MPVKSIRVINTACHLRSSSQYVFFYLVTQYRKSWNHLRVIEHDQSYTSSVVSALFRKPWSGEKVLLRGEVPILNFVR